MQQLTIGPHQIELDGDVFVVHWRGNPELGPLAQVYERLAQFIAERGYALALFDLSQAGVPGSEARRWAGQWWRKQEPGRVFVASYGMNAPVRTVMLLINRALALFQSEGPVSTALCSGEPEARSWLAEQRALITTTQITPIRMDR